MNAANIEENSEKIQDISPEAEPVQNTNTEPQNPLRDTRLDVEI